MEGKTKLSSIGISEELKRRLQHQKGNLSWEEYLEFLSALISEGHVLLKVGENKIKIIKVEEVWDE